MRQRTSPELLNKMDAYWRAANYLSVGQIYLYDNPLLKRPLTLADVKHMLLDIGHDPRPELHLCALEQGHQEIRPRHDLCLRSRTRRPGRGEQHYLEGTYSEIYPNISQDEAGLRSSLFSFRFPEEFQATHLRSARDRSTRWRTGLFAQPFVRGGVRQSQSDRRCVVGDGEAETGPLATRGIRTSSSIRPPTARCCRSCISTL